MPVVRLASEREIVAGLPGIFDGALMMPTRRVVSALRASGVRLSAEPEESLASALRTADRPYYWLAGDAFLADGVAMVAGRTFTHAVTAAGLTEDVLEGMPDFAGPMLDLLIQFGVRLPDGRLVRPFDPVPDGQVAGFGFPIRLPVGVLSGMGLRPGDLVGLTGTAGGCPDLAPARVLDGDRLGSVLVRRLGVESGPLPVDAVVIAALALEQWPDGVQPPISVAAAEAGLACDDRHIAPLGVPLGSAGGIGWDAQSLAEVYDLRGDQARAVAAALAVVDSGERVAGELAGSVLEGLDGVDLDPDDPDSRVLAELSGSADLLMSGVEQAAREVLEAQQLDLGQVGAVLADPFCALVVAEEALEGFDPQVIGLGMLVLLLDKPGLPRPARAAVDYLRGRQLEFLEGPQSAEAAYRACVAQVADHPGALESLARIAVDRSQYPAARSLIDRAGVLPSHPVVSFLTEMVEHGHPLDRAGTVVALGGRARNQPCPCGSGRKYKLCHGHAASGSGAVSVRERAHQLYDKAVLFAKVRHPGYLVDLLRDVLDEGEEMADTLIPTVLDAVLFNAGVLEEYLDLRGDLLTQVERDLIGAWLARGPSVYEVEGCEPGQWLDLRDLRTGARHRVTEYKGSQQVRQQMLLYTRVADVGDRQELYGGISVIRVHELDGFLDLLDHEPDADDVIGYLLDQFGPPALVTVEGDPIELCTATFTTTAPVKLARELDRRFTRDTPSTWSVTADTDSAGGPADVVRALASLALTGRTLTLQAMSRARMAHVIDLLDTVQAKLTQTGLEVTDPAQLRGGDGEPSGTELGLTADPSLTQDPAVHAAIASHIAQYETSWVDTPIPALHGLTPRQAAADPTRREDLERLLAEFPSTGSPLQMDAQRLRQLLDLWQPEACRDHPANAQSGLCGTVVVDPGAVTDRRSAGTSEASATR